jgi:SAM-dependent methyltransferase
MASRSCPVCDTPSTSARLFLSESIDPSKLSGYSFASRKTPEFMRHRLVQCATCDLVYADEPPAAEELAHAYHCAEYDSSEEADDAAAAYVKAIGPLLQKVRGRASALEIGTGTGVFLEHLGRAGFNRLVGVEPSPAAIAAAPAHRRGWIRQAMFDKSDFEPASFDLVCCFMTMEHVRDPLAVARSAWELVRPGGAFVTVTHDWRGLVNRLLGSRSPIIDIEHLQLFSQASLRRLFSNAGFVGFDARPFANRYALRYWTRLAPLPGGMKQAVASGFEATGLARLKMSVNVGNTIAYGIRGA